jgi:hypothetical protein
MYCCSPRHASLKRKTKDWGRRGRDRMVVGFITTYAISAYHHWCCGFESRSGRGAQHHVIKFVSDLRQVVLFPGRPVSSTSKTDLHDITEQLLKLALSSIKQISKNKDWYARNDNNVSEWRHMSSRGLLFQWAITMNIQLSVLVYKVDIIIISSNITCSCHAMPEPFGHLVIHTNHSVTHYLLKEF